MTTSPLLWNVGESIPIELSVNDPSTELALPGQDGYLTLTIQRFSDNKYWNGFMWAPAMAHLSFVEVDSIHQPGRYTYILSATANAQADRYMAHANINNPKIIIGDTYELHVSRELNVNVNVYDSAPVDMNNCDDCD